MSGVTDSRREVKLACRKDSLHPIRDVQVLTPMNRGSLGARALNVALQEALNADATPTVTRFGWSYAPGDKVLQTINDYEKDTITATSGRWCGWTSMRGR